MGKKFKVCYVLDAELRPSAEEKKLLNEDLQRGLQAAEGMGKEALVAAIMVHLTRLRAEGNLATLAKAGRRLLIRYKKYPLSADDLGLSEADLAHPLNPPEPISSAGAEKVVEEAPGAILGVATLPASLGGDTLVAPSLTHAITNSSLLSPGEVDSSVRGRDLTALTAKVDQQLVVRMRYLERIAEGVASIQASQQVIREEIAELKSNLNSVQKKISDMSERMDTVFSTELPVQNEVMAQRAAREELAGPELAEPRLLSKVPGSSPRRNPHAPLILLDRAEGKRRKTDK